MTTPGDRSEFLSVARALLLDRAAGIAVDHLRRAGIEVILLKGAVIATWLYDDGAARPYADVDLWVSPAEFERATNVLSELGYVHWLAGADPTEVGPKERELLGPGKVWIDLHLGFVGMTADPERCWEVLSRRTADFTVAGTPVKAFDVPARALHLALHAAQNGPVDVKALEDLRRGLARVDEVCWREAATLAEEVGATEAFAAGLRLLPEGCALADALSLPHRMSVELALRARSAPQTAIFFERLLQTPGLRRKAALVIRKVFPTRAYLQGNLTTDRRGGPDLFRFWLSHTLSLFRDLGPAFLAWLRTRKLVRTR